ncbi:MAG: cytochrome ubiquinol oxidase subunit I [Candidatus Korarchaeota archaeon]|nr:cytochrome ubiquinol oxidase subunit I [Candidatus Korarchaeota archaeon]
MDPFGLIQQWLSGYPAGWERVLSMIGIEVHWFILQYVLGLSFLAVVAEAIWLRTGNEDWKRLSRTLAKAFVAVFAVGAATGTASEFGLVLLWPNLTEAAGRYIYFPLYMEIFAFIMEGVFIYMYFYAEHKVSPKTHLLIGVLAFVGAWFSAAMILSVNSFMQAPVNVIAHYDPIAGPSSWAPPDVLLFVPAQIAQAIDVNKLAAVGAKVINSSPEQVTVTLPSGLVRILMGEAFSGKTIGESTLAAVLKPEALQTLSSVPLKEVIDAIVANTVENAGTFMITFLSKGYLATFVHSLGAAMTVSGFTLLGGYALRILRTSDDDRDRDYFRRALKFAALVALITVAIQGTGSGHAMGAAVAKYNPEKFAAMEATTTKIQSLPGMIGMKQLVDQLMPLLAYGNPNAKLPSYDVISEEFRPPLLVHYLYYTKIGLGVLLGLIGLVAVFLAFKRENWPSWALWVAVISPALAHITSFLGWGVREMGRKPWAIYGIMDVKTELTINPPPPWQLMGVALYLSLILAVLVIGVYWFLWRR